MLPLMNDSEDSPSTWFPLEESLSNWNAIPDLESQRTKAPLTHAHVSTQPAECVWSVFPAGQRTQQGDYVQTVVQR